MIRHFINSSINPLNNIPAKHFDSLRSYCTRNEDFIDLCMRLASEQDRWKNELVNSIHKGEVNSGAFGAYLHGRVHKDIETRLCQGRATGSEAVNLLYVSQCILLSDSDNETLNSIVRWNELPLLQTDSFYLGITPEKEFGVGICQLSDSQWKIEISYGFRSLISEAVILYWEVLHGRCKIDPAQHLYQNIRRVFSGELPRQIPGVLVEHVSQTGILALLAKLFVFSHEIGHVIAHRDKFLFEHQCDEEFFADKMGQSLYLSSALMMMPPFDKLVASGEISNVNERRERMLSDPKLQSMILQWMIGGELDKAELPESKLFQSPDDEQRAVFFNKLIWVIPILVFKLFECFEKVFADLGKTLPDTHPPALARIKAFWNTQPDNSMRKIVESEVLPPLEKIFK